MKSRAEAVELIRKQLDHETPEQEQGPSLWHYGRFELRLLMDFIYEGEPKTEEEYIP